LIGSYGDELSKVIWDWRNAVRANNMYNIMLTTGLTISTDAAKRALRSETDLISLVILFLLFSSCWGDLFKKA